MHTASQASWAHQWLVVFNTSLEAPSLWYQWWVSKRAQLGSCDWLILKHVSPGGAETGLEGCTLGRHTEQGHSQGVGSTVLVCIIGKNGARAPQDCRAYCCIVRVPIGSPLSGTRWHTVLGLFVFISLAGPCWSTPNINWLLCLCARQLFKG